MLVLSRYENEKVYIGDNVVLTVLSIHKGRVRLGIEAPREVNVLRVLRQEKDESPFVSTEVAQKIVDHGPTFSIEEYGKDFKDVRETETL